MKCPGSIYIRVVSIAVVLAISHANVYAQKTPTPTPTPPEAQTTPALPDARVGIEYKFELKAEMGTPPLKWSLAQGPLPPGIELSDKGIIHGVPLAATQSPVVFAVEVSDASSPPWQTKMYFSLSVSHEGVLNPATFIRILEDPKTGSRQTIYEPSQHALARHIQGTADEGSMIVIRPVARLMSDDVALNKLYITAKLASGDSSKDVPVVGYSEIGKDKATMASQTATAFESASNIKTMILDMSYTVDDIIRRVYDSCLPTENTDSLLTFQEWKKSKRDIDLDGDCVKQIDKKIATAVRSTATEAQPKPPAEAQQKPPEELEAFQERLRLYQPEIQNIAGFFSNAQNLAIVEKIGADVFWIDRDTLESIAKQYKANVQALAEPAITDQRKAQIYDDLLERTKLIYRDFSDLRAKILSVMCTEDKCSGKHSKDEWEQFYQEATQKVANGMQKSALAGLKRLLAPGTISLAEQKAKDGDRLTITVETVPSNATSGGIQTVFEITVKKYGVKVGLGSSLLFIRRLGVTDAEATPPTGSNITPVNRVNFAPSPGVTFAMAFFKRGNSGWDKFLRGLGPGAGINVSFMNFNDPSFDLSTGKFVNTNGANVQVGSGIIGSLFDNKIQVSYGWNLNVEQRRNYFGVGFDFIRAGESIAKLFK